VPVFASTSPALASIAQHGDAIGDLEDLGELVRDEDHRDPPLLEVADDLEQPGSLRGR